LAHNPGRKEADMASIRRRDFLAGAAAGTFAILRQGAAAAEAAPAGDPVIPGTDIPLVDYHVHVEAAPTLEKLIEISQARGTRFGIVEHAGTKENKYPVVLSTDEDLKRHIASLEGRPAYKGVQAEFLDWATCFSKDVVAQLDYVLSDALTFREEDGRRVELWKAEKVKIGDPQDFMERYADFNVQVISTEPIDIFANPTFLPAVLAKDFDALWTPARMKRIIDAAVKHTVAIEISSSYRLPRLAFLKMAKEAGAKFSFGSNIRGPNVGKLDYCLDMVKAMDLKREHIFTPAASIARRATSTTTAARTS
jgi:histidinol phosphatase-like PHP family hydrolase